MKNFLLPILLLASLNLLSQNYLFDTNSSGFSVGGQLTSNNGSTLIAAIPSYTSNGKLTFGFGIGYESNDDLDLNSTAIKPSISYLVLKQGENNNPVSVGLNGSFQYNTFSDFDGLTGNTIGFGASLHHEINASETVKIIPGGAVGWNKITIRQDGNNIGDDIGITYGILGTVAFNKFYVEPSLLFSEGNSVFVLSFGIIFPK